MEIHEFSFMKQSSTFMWFGSFEKQKRNFKKPADPPPRLRGIRQLRPCTISGGREAAGWS